MTQNSTNPTNEGPMDEQLSPVTNPVKTEPSKWIPIGISCFALVISCLGWWDSHRGRIINEEINRPNLAISGVTTSPSVVSVSAKDKTIIWFTIKLKNSGRVTAMVDQHRVQPFLLFQTDDCKVDDAEFMLSPQGLEILSGSEESVMCRIAIAGLCEQRPSLSFGLRMVIRYTEAGSGKQYVQDLVSDVIDIPVQPETTHSTPPKGRQRRSSKG
jgi:hypothetical protein